MYIDDLVVVRKEKVSTYTVDASDMQPLDSGNYTKSNVTSVTDEELGQQVFKIAPNGSLKYSVNDFVKRFIADKGGMYRINFKVKNAEKIGIEGISTYVDRSKIDNGDYKTTNNRDFANVVEVANTQDYKEVVYLYSEKGTNAVSFNGKNADIFRAIDFVNLSSEKDLYVYDITVSKVNKFSPLPAFNADFDNWGWNYTKQNANSFVFSEGKLNINALLNNMYEHGTTKTIKVMGVDGNPIELTFSKGIWIYG